MAELFRLVNYYKLARWVLESMWAVAARYPCWLIDCLLWVTLPRWVLKQVKWCKASELPWRRGDKQKSATLESLFIIVCMFFSNINVIFPMGFPWVVQQKSHFCHWFSMGCPTKISFLRWVCHGFTLFPYVSYGFSMGCPTKNLIFATGFPWVQPFSMGFPFLHMFPMVFPCVFQQITFLP